MRTLATHFTFEKILYVLINKRLAYSSARHDTAFFGKISSAKQKQRSKEDTLMLQLHKIFPPRDTWVHIDKRKRDTAINGTHEIAFKQLLATVMKSKAELKKEGKEPDWLMRLNALVVEIRNVLKQPEQITLKPIGYKYIPKNPETHEYRGIANYSLRDTVVISLVSNYLTDHADIGTTKPYFLENSFAFRSSKLQKKHGISFTYHSAVRKIESFRRKNYKDGIFAAEIDLQKFYDCFNHTIVRVCLEKFCDFFNRVDNPVDPRAIIITENYLTGFSFNKNLLPKEKPGKIEFKWPAVLLKDLGIDVNKERIGVPQGGALSCFFSNLVLHELDLIFPIDDGELSYLRYCDDFIILHKSKDKCQEYVDKALNRLEELKLVVHSPYKFNLTDYKKRVQKHANAKEVNEFWNLSKSKNPYRWGPYHEDISNVPYVAFVGYQIRFDGLIRVRKKSIRKEFQKQRQLVSEIIKRVSGKSGTIIKKRIPQISFRAEQKLIAMSVGKISHLNAAEELGFCWANGFKEMNNHPLKLNAQLKNLDKARETQLHRLRLELMKVPKHKFPEKTPGEPIDKIPGILTSYYHYFNK